MYFLIALEFLYCLLESGDTKYYSTGSKCDLAQQKNILMYTHNDKHKYVLLYKHDRGYYNQSRLLQN